MRKVISLLVLGVIVLFASNASASIAPALPPAGYPVAGEAELTYTTGGTTYTVYVDWIVDHWAVDPEYGDIYIYLYQVENLLGTTDIIDSFQIQPIPGTVVDYGWAEDEETVKVDLDTGLDKLSDFIYEHRVAYFGNLAGENEPAAGTETIEGVTSASYETGIGDPKIEWTFDGAPNGIVPGDESDTLWLASHEPPGYYPAEAQNTVTFSGHVPAPMPEPSSMLLIGMGLFGFAGRTIRKRFKA